MWPERGEAIRRTLEAEAALADIYAAALNQWVTAAQPLVVPSLVAATLPPDPDSVEQTSAVWDQLSGELILACVSALWSLSLMEALTGLGLALPEIDAGRAESKHVPVEVIRAITSTSSIAESEIIEAVHRVESDPHLRQARDDYMAGQRETVATAPALMHDKIVAAIRDRPTDSTNIDVRIQYQREAATAVLTPGSDAVRDVARYQGYQAAGAQNAAVISAGMRSQDVAQLEKTWIATLDGKTRDTHFAADGQRAPLTGTFSVGNAALRFPGDPTGPPAEVRNCRCRVGILAKDEEIPDEVDRHTERGPGNSTVRNRIGSQADEIARRAADGTIRARDDDDGVGRTASAVPSEEHTMNVKDKARLIGEGIIGLTADGSADPPELFRTFTDQPVAFVGIETSDGRMLAKDIDFSVRTPPMPVMWVKQTGYGHEDAYTVGVMEAARVDGDTMLASGYLLNSGEADEAAVQLEHTATRPSVDLGRVEWILTDEDGKEITEEDWWDLPMDAKVIQTITAAELIGVTLVATPAFGDTKLTLNAERESRDAALVASVTAEFKPRIYSAALFAETLLPEPTLPTIDEETGRIYGHLACFDGCHRSIQAPGECTIAPRSPSKYGNFHTSPAVRLDNGERIPVGRLTVGTGHYSTAPGTSAAAALAHYDNTGHCFALVRMYEDAHGIAFSGVAAPWATPEQIEMGLSAPLSGDWRNIDGQGLDLIAALAVNTPGFAIRGNSGSDGRAAALVAALGPPRGKRQDDVQLTAEAIGQIVEQAATRALEAMATRREADALLAEAVGDVGPLPTPNDEIGELLVGVEL